MVDTKEITVNNNSDVQAASKGVVVNLDHGDPTMFEEFWSSHGPEADITISGSSTMSYFSQVSNLCWFMEEEFANQIKRLHNLVGNAVVDDNRYIIIGTGSSQLFQATLFALSSSDDATEPMSVVSKIPWYSVYPVATDFLRSNLFRWAGDATKFKGDKYIEVVCTPNNPDGFVERPLLDSKLGKIIHDLAYYWPQYTPITHAADHDIMLFTLSKCTGHAGTRLGWAIVKDYAVAKKILNFIEISSIGVSKDSQLRAAQIMKVICDSYEFPSTEDIDSEKFFTHGRAMMENRWKKLREAVKVSAIFSLPEFPSDTCNFTGETFTTYPAFAWLKCEKDEVDDCEAFLRSHNIVTRSGRHSGAGPKYVRISMLDRSDKFNIFIERLTSLK